MKNLVIFLIALIFSTGAFAQSHWSQWQTSNCMKGLDYRVQRVPGTEMMGNATWKVQFRNRYQKAISFTYKGYAPTDEIDGGLYRLHIKGNGDTYEDTSRIDQKASSIVIYTERFRFGEDLLMTDYAPCDRD